MLRIGLLSDTHSHVDDRILNFFDNCDEIWHAGDIGNIEAADILEKKALFRAVYGNIDSHELRLRYPRDQRFKCEKMDVWITHIGGYPGRYDKNVIPNIYLNPPDLFISGHSHILKVINDPKNNLLHINPGAAGKSGIHQVRTVIRFKIDGKKIKDLEVLEIPRS